MADLAPGVVTLFGGSGFIGSQAVRALARRGWRIRIAVRNPVLAIEIQPLGDPGQIQFMRCDITCLLYTSPSPRDQRGSRMPSSA